MWNSRMASASSNRTPRYGRPVNFPPKAKFDRQDIEDWCRAGFDVHYNNGQTAEVSWAFISELRPKKSPEPKSTSS